MCITKSKDRPHTRCAVDLVPGSISLLLTAFCGVLPCAFITQRGTWGCWFLLVLGNSQPHIKLVGEPPPLTHSLLHLCSSWHKA